MTKNKIYEVYKDGLPIVKGTVPECAKVLGVTEKHFRQMATNLDYKKYEIVDVTDVDKSPNAEYKKAIEKWDAFAASARKKYGVPVYKARDGAK